VLSIEEFKKAILGTTQQVMAETPRQGSPGRASARPQGGLQSISEDEWAMPPRSSSQMDTSRRRSSPPPRSASVPPEFDAIRPSTGAAAFGAGSEAALRRDQEQRQAARQREIDREQRSQRGVQPARPATGLSESPQQQPKATARGASEARAKHSARMAQAHGSKKGSQRGVSPNFKDGLGLTNYFAIHSDPLRAPSRVGSPNPYLPSPLASPERFLGAPMSIEDARQMTLQRKPTQESARARAFEQRVFEQDARSSVLNDGGLQMRGGSPQSQALVAEMKSRDLQKLRGTVERHAMGTKAPAKASRPATQASFGFDGPDALKSARTPQFIPKLQTGGASPFGSPPLSAMSRGR